MRETIEYLTKVFETHGLCCLKAEHFRSAKFDKQEPTDKLWQLLSELVLTLNHGTLDDYSKDLISHMKPEEKVVYCKEAMQDLGYLNSEFSQLPEDMSSGSREVLLAVGWLLSSKKLLDKFVSLQLSPLEKESPQTEAVVLGDQFQTTDKLSPVDKMRQLQLVNGRLYLSLKRLYSLYQHEVKLKHQVHACTRGVSGSVLRPHLSVLEVYLLRHPQQLKMCLKELERGNKRLECLLLWKEHEHVFWKWMESVLQLKVDEMSSTHDDVPQIPVVHYNITAGLLGDLTIARRNLESSIMKCEPVITQLEELWEKKQEQLATDDFRTLQTAVTVEIEESKQKCHKHLQDSVFLSKNRDPRLVFLKPSQRKAQSVQITDTAQDIGISDSMELQTEIEHLEKKISRLQCQLHRTERYCRQQLDKKAALIPDAICIQPASLTR